MLMIEDHEGIRLLTMQNGDENRYSGPFVDALFAAYDEAEADASVKGVALTGGSPKFFSNGLDIGWIMRLDPSEVAPFLTRFGLLLRRNFLFPKPLVAAINGHAFAGGLFMACGCDYRVMREDRGWCCVSEIDLSLDLPPGYVSLLNYAVGFRRADWLAITAQRVTAPEAVKIGLVEEAVALERVTPRALEVARALAAKPASQFARHKRLLRERAAAPFKDEDPAFYRAMIEEKTGKVFSAGA